MLFLNVMRLGVLSILVYLFITQILLPIWKGVKTFPMFRRVADIKDEIVDANQKNYEEELLSDLSSIRSKEKNKQSKRREK